EIAHILRDGVQRMYGEGSGPDGDGQGEDVIYYLTVYNEPMHQPAQPENLDVEGLLKGIYLWSPADNLVGIDEGITGDAGKAAELEHTSIILAADVGIVQAIRAKQMLAEDGGNTNISAVTSWNELARDGQEAGLEELRNPGEEQRTPYIQQVLEG